MKKTILLLLLFIHFGSNGFGQTTIRFKEAEYTIIGKSAEKINNVYQEESTLECFWEINNETRTVQLTTVEIIQTEHPDNNTNIQKEELKISDIDQNMIPDEPMEEFNLLGVPFYSVTLSSDNSAFKVVNSYCYISSPSNEFIQGKPGFSFTIKFSNKEFATQFLTLLKDELLN